MWKKQKALRREAFPPITKERISVSLGKSWVKPIEEIKHGAEVRKTRFLKRIKINNPVLESNDVSEESGGESDQGEESNDSDNDDDDDVMEEHEEEEESSGEDDEQRMDDDYLVSDQVQDGGTGTQNIKSTLQNKDLLLVSDVPMEVKKTSSTFVKAAIKKKLKKAVGDGKISIPSYSKA